jgi:hypothetical protein
VKKSILSLQNKDTKYIRERERERERERSNDVIMQMLNLHKLSWKK